MGTISLNSILQWDDIEEVERKHYERNRRLRGDDNEPPLEDEHDNIDNENEETE